jgi:F-type H+-transporting ATPase subunit b
VDLNPLNQIQPVVIGAVMLIFTAVWFVLRKVYFLPYIEVMEARERRFETAEAREAEAQRIVADAEPETRRMVDEAQAEADRILTDAREEAARYRRNTLKAANDEAARLLEEGRSKLASARTAELTAVRQEAVDCVNLACGKLLGEAHPDAAGKAVDKLIARRMH